MHQYLVDHHLHILLLTVHHDDSVQVHHLDDDSIVDEVEEVVDEVDGKFVKILDVFLRNITYTDNLESNSCIT